MLASYFQLLKELLAIKAVSLDSSCFDAMEKKAIYLNALLQDNGFSSEIVHGYGNPLVLAKYTVDPWLPTVLLYWYYDVYPASDAWRKHDPFSLYIGKDKIYWRWVAQNMWCFLIYLLTVFSLIQSQKLWYNVVVLIEWNHEIWSLYMEQFLREYSGYLTADFCIFSDGYMVENVPCITLGCRWWIDVLLNITSASSQLSSWLYGWVVPNALLEMTHILSALYDRRYKITIPYFYYDVKEPPFDVLVAHKKMQTHEKIYMSDLWISGVSKDTSVDFLTQLWCFPTIQITGISSSYQKDVVLHTIPCFATAHLDFRLVPSQKTKNILDAFSQRLHATVPQYLEYEVVVKQAYEPIVFSSDDFYIKKARLALETVFSRSVVSHYSWWGHPIATLLKDVLSVWSVIVPLVNHDSFVYGINENFDIALIEKWFDFATTFFST